MPAASCQAGRFFKKKVFPQNVFIIIYFCIRDWFEHGLFVVSVAYVIWQNMVILLPNQGKCNLASAPKIQFSQAKTYLKSTLREFANSPWVSTWEFRSTHTPTHVVAQARWRIANRKKIENIMTMFTTVENHQKTLVLLLSGPILQWSLARRWAKGWGWGPRIRPRVWLMSAEDMDRFRYKMTARAGNGSGAKRRRERWEHAKVITI